MLREDPNRHRGGTESREQLSPARGGRPRKGWEGHSPLPTYPKGTVSSPGSQTLKYFLTPFVCPGFTTTTFESDTQFLPFNSYRANQSVTLRPTWLGWGQTLEGGEGFNENDGRNIPTTLAARKDEDRSYPFNSENSSKG